MTRNLHRTRICAVAAAALLVVAMSGANEVADLAAGLGALDRDQAAQALDAVVARGAKAVPALRKVLTGRDQLARQYAAAALGRINRPGADHALVACLREQRAYDPYLMQFAGEALAARGEAALPLLRKALRLDSPPPREFRPEELEWTFVGDWLGALPQNLVDRLMVEVARRPELSDLMAPGLRFVEEGPAGMRKWANAYARDVPFPTVEVVNRAWRDDADDSDARDVLRHLLGRWSLSGMMSPDRYQIELGEKRRPWLQSLLWQAARSSRPEQRYWAYWHLLTITPASYSKPPNDERLAVLRGMLTDTHWAIPLLLERNGSLDLSGAEADALLPELRDMLVSPCEPLQVLAANKLLETGDEVGVTYMVRELLAACDRTAEVLCFGASWGMDQLTDDQRLRLLGPLVEAAKRASRAWLVLAALSEMPSDAVPAIAALLQHDEPETRKIGAQALGEIGARSAVPLLERALGDRDDEVRIEAAGALGKVLKADVGKYVDSLLASDDPTSHEAAFWAAYNAEEPELVARVLRRAPEACDFDDNKGLSAPWWPPNMAPEVRAATREERMTSDELRDKPLQSPEPVLEAAREVFADAKASTWGRWKAAYLIVWDWVQAHPYQRWPEDDNEAQNRDHGLPDDVWQALAFVLTHADVCPRMSVDLNLDGAIAQVRRADAVPLLLRATTDPALRGRLHSGPLEALAAIRPAGVKALIDIVEKVDDRQLQRNAINELARSKVVEAYEPLSRLVSLGEARPDVLAQLGDPRAIPLLRKLARLPQNQMRQREFWRALQVLKYDRLSEMWEEALRHRGHWADQSSAVIGLGGLKNPEDLPLLLSVVNDELQVYYVRYRALRAVERQRPELARKIAKRWARDYRFGMRQQARRVLRGEERMYL